MEGNVYARAYGNPGDEVTATFFSDLVRCETRLYNALNDRLRRRHGITASQYEFLRYLREHPHARVGDLAAFFAVGVGATSKGIDRLAARELVSRRPDPADGRSSQLALTDAGTRLLHDADTAFAEIGDLLRAALPQEQIHATAQALRRLRGRLEDDRTGTPIG
ncbi:MarR family winged helix-turn-helix transcriptional regulator [Streptomyces sp. ME03-5709C]|nr:MarR family winged helix-turn-helix transcriptional regulator [Streptomyces sp. ME03-5709C]